jgi:hypothetical protein
MRKVSSLVGLTALILSGAAMAQDEAPAAAPAGDAAPAAAAPAAADTAAPAAAVAGPESKMQLGLNVLPMLMGKVKGEGGASLDLAMAYGVGLSFGYAVIPGLYVGVAPQAIFNVKPKDGGDAAKEYDLLVRVAYNYTVAPKINLLVEVMPGYSIVSPPSGSSGKGLVVAGGIGGSYDVTDQAFVNLGVGYQYGMQKIDSAKFNVSFLRIAVGGGMRF